MEKLLWVGRRWMDVYKMSLSLETGKNIYIEISNNLTTQENTNCMLKSLHLGKLDFI